MRITQAYLVILCCYLVILFAKKDYHCVETLDNVIFSLILCPHFK